MKSMKITPPEGYEIDKEKSTFDEIVFKKRESLPTTWKELGMIHGYYINNYSKVARLDVKAAGDNIAALPTKEIAMSVIALCQLIYLRDVYNNGWVPDWTVSDTKFTITSTNNEITRETAGKFSFILAFQFVSIRDQFYTNFKGLIEIAKPLL